jgi:hypothetical protein
MTTMIAIASVLLIALTCGLWWLARRENSRLQNELSALQGEQKLLRDILRCPNYGIASQIRRVRTYNLAVLVAPEPTPHITRLEQDIKLEVLFGKLALWGVNNTILGTDDTAPLSRYSPELYERLAIATDEHHEYSQDIGLVFRMQDEIQRRHNSGQYGYKQLLESPHR